MRPHHPWGAAIRETVANFEGCWGGPAESGPTRTQIRPHHPWGAAICGTVATFEGCWGSSIATCYADSSSSSSCSFLSAAAALTVRAPTRSSLALRSHPPMSSSSPWLSLLVHVWLSCASCHVRVSHVAYTTYYGACTLIVHASLGQLFLSLDANGLGTSQGNFEYSTAVATSRPPPLPTCLLARSVLRASLLPTWSSLWGCDLRNCRHFRELLGGPAQWVLIADSN